MLINKARPEASGMFARSEPFDAAVAWGGSPWSSHMNHVGNWEPRRGRGGWFVGRPRRSVVGTAVAKVSLPVTVPTED